MEDAKAITEAIRHAFRVGVGFYLDGTTLIPVAKCGEDGPSLEQAQALEAVIAFEFAATRLASMLEAETVPPMYHDDGVDCWCEPELTATCSRCDGRGFYRKRPCKNCGGRGRNIVFCVDKADTIRHRNIPGREL